MQIKERILLKLTGEALLDAQRQALSTDLIRPIIKQIEYLKDRYIFGIVIGGGNFFRGNQYGPLLGLQPTTSHEIGMVATMCNGLILKDLFDQANIPSILLNALLCPSIGTPVNQQTIDRAIEQERILIFAGGTGNPFFTTDTNAVLRSLQIGASSVWKATTVSGVFDSDPRTNPNAQFLKKVTYKEALAQQLHIMDSTAFALAQQYKQVIRVFNVFVDDALIIAADNADFGSIIH